MKLSLLGGLVVVCVALVPATAHAQYKNNQFSLTAGAMFLFPANNTAYYDEQQAVAPNGSYPSTTPTSPNGLLSDGSRYPHGMPYRLANPELTLTYLGKLSDDSHWWFSAGLNFGLLGQISAGGTGVDAIYYAAGANGNVLGWIEPMGGPRFYILTDEIRPFIEIGLRCGFVIGANPLIVEQLQIIPGIYAEIGIEFVVARDIALLVAGRYTATGASLLGFTYESLAEGVGGVTFYF